MPTLKLKADDCSDASASRGPGSLGLLASAASRVDGPGGHVKLVDAQRGREAEVGVKDGSVAALPPAAVRAVAAAAAAAIQTATAMPAMGKGAAVSGSSGFGGGHTVRFVL